MTDLEVHGTLCTQRRGLPSATMTVCGLYGNLELCKPKKQCKQERVENQCFPH